MKARHIIICLALSLWGAGLQALAQDLTQNSNVNSYLSTMFEDMELNRVPTGYLLDRAFEVADLSLYDGQSLSDGNLADIGSFRNSLLTINSSVVNSNGQSHNIDSLLNVMADSTAVVLGAAVFKYNYIVANALTDNLISYQNNKVYDVYSSGVWRNPYDSTYAFVFAPSVDYVEDTAVRFRFSPSSIIGNCICQSIEFDPGNGSGFTTISDGYDQIVFYSMSGTKELKMRVTLADNTVLLGHANIELSAPEIAPSSTATQPDERRTYTYFVSQNKTISAVVSYKCAPGHNGNIIRPLIYVEGFDDPVFGFFTKGMFFHHLFQKSKGTFDFYWLYDEALAEANSLKNNYDIVYVDWKNPSADIRDNAALLKEIIIDINDEKHASSSLENNIVVGHSMGGLIARYALRTMEISFSQFGGARHETAYFVSLDSPQRGANLPLGLQYAFRDAYWLLYGDFMDGGGVFYGGGVISSSFADMLINHAVRVLESPSAKQMMYYYVDSSQNRSTYFHDSWQAVLNEIGYPQGDYLCPIENLAVSNGGTLSNEPDPLFDFHMEIGDHGISWLSYLLRTLTVLHNINASFTVNHNRGDGGLISSAYATYRKKFLWFPVGNEISLFSGRNTLHYSPAGTVGYDEIRSSCLSFKDIVETTIYGDSLSLFLADSLMAFIPEASALDCSNYNRNYYNNPPIPLDETPFYAYYLSEASLNHTAHKRVWSWLNNQTNLRFDRMPVLIQTGDTLSVIDNSTYPTRTWTTSNSAVATVNSIEGGNKGVVSVHSPGPVRISYCSNDGSAYCYKHRDVFAGFPEMVLEKGYSGSGTYTITASCANRSISSSFFDYVNNGVFSYVWGRKSGTNDIVWEQPSQSSSFLCAFSPNETVSVYLKIRAENGSTGTPVFIQVQKENVEYFSHDPQAVYVYDRFIDYDLQSITGFIQDGDLHIRPWFLSLWRNSSHPNSLVPQKVKVGPTEEICLAASYLYDLDGATITLYRFNIMQSDFIQDTIDEIRSYSGNMPFYNFLLRIPVYCNNEIEQYIVLPFIKAN